MLKWKGSKEVGPDKRRNWYRPPQKFRAIARSERIPQVSYKDFRFSSSTIAQVVSDIRTGAADDFVASFFAGRSDWQDQTDAQTDEQTEQAEQKEEAK
jgi:hypothetical protein